jgi:hypothetical protein
MSKPSAKVEDWQDDPAKVAANKAFSAEVNAIKSGEPSATTPDVEKIAREWQIVDYGDSIGMVLQQGDDELAVLDTKLVYARAVILRDRHNKALAQARAPLVELRMALERAQARIYFLNGQKDDAFTRDIATALTGMGEK